MQHLSAVTDDIHVIQAEYFVVEELFHYKCFADADRMHFGSCPICRSIMRFHAEYGVSLNQERGWKIFGEAVRRIGG